MTLLPKTWGLADQEEGSGRMSLGAPPGSLVSREEDMTLFQYFVLQADFFLAI